MGILVYKLLIDESDDKFVLIIAERIPCETTFAV